MCGRFTLRTPLNKLIEHFVIDVQAASQLSLFNARYNIAPTQEILTIRQADEQREPAMMRWGLVPPWYRDPKTGPLLINARAETLAEKPTFREAFRQRRCLIPADGFYEWQKVAASKQPNYIHRPDHEPIAFAGLWERWEGEPTVESCTIVTTAANKTLSSLHDRMPVVLSPLDYAAWLNPATNDPNSLIYLLVPASDDTLIAEPVSTVVNDPRNDVPECVKTIS